MNHIDGFQEPCALFPLDPPKEPPSAAVRAISQTAVRPAAPLQRTVSVQSSLGKWDQQFLRRLSVVEKEAATAAAVSISPDQMKEALAAIQFSTPSQMKERLKDPAYKKQISASVLKAYLEGHLDEMEAAKYFLYLRCLTSSQETCVHSINDEWSLRLLSRALPGWSKAHLRDLLTKAEERVFFSFHTPFIEEPLTPIDPANYNVQFLSFSLGFVVEGEQIRNFIFPPKLWQEILNVRFGSNAIRVQPILGYSEQEKFSDYSQRIVSIPADFATVPTQVHNIVDGKDNLAMYQHDAFYHVPIESANPHRAIWTKIALAVKQQEKKIGIVFLDRNCPHYITRKLEIDEEERTLKNQAEMFWASLNVNLVEACASEKTVDFIFEFIFSKAEEWQKEYGVDLSRQAFLACEDSFGEILDEYREKTISRMAPPRVDQAPSTVIKVLPPSRSLIDRMRELLAGFLLA